jgi:ATP-dependent exoDNAse (exonuclease V) alpha subunit
MGEAYEERSMAIYHLSVKAIGRSAGRSATAAAAYRAAVEIADERTGEVHDYRRKQGVLHSEIVLPAGAGEWAADRARLWNAAELAETRRNSTVAREFEVALPSELNAEERTELTRALAQEIAARHRCAVDLSIHRPDREGDHRNHHAHVLCTTRRLEGFSLTEKTRELDDLKSGEVTRWRSRWAELVNDHLHRHGHSARVDHRSLEAQGEERIAQSHLGPAVSAMERRGIRTEVGWRIQQEANDRLARAAELGKIERERQEVEKSVLDLSGDLEAAKRERDGTQSSKPDLETRQRQAREAWLKYRADHQAVPNAAQSEKSADLDKGTDQEQRPARDGPDDDLGL